MLNQWNVSKRVYLWTFIISLILVGGIIVYFDLPLHFITILILPILTALPIFKDRTYLYLLIPYFAVVVLLAFFVSVSIYHAIITAVILALTLLVFGEISISYFNKIKRFEEELKRGKDEFERLLNHTYDWEYWLKPDGSFGYSSPSCVYQTGYTKEEFIADKNLLAKIVHPEDKEKFNAHCKELDSKEPGKIEFKIIKKSGKIRVIRHTCQPIYDSNGKFIGRRATNRNATDRWLAEQKLKENEEKYRNIFNSLIDVYYRTTMDGTIELVSPSVERISGYKPEFVIGKNAALFYKDKKDREKFLKKIKEKGALQNYEVKFVDAKGETKILSFNNRLVKNEKGEPVAIEGILRDVTELKKKEEALRKAEFLAQEYLDIANVMILALDREANITLINRKGAEILGVDQKEIIGKNFNDVFISPEERKKVKAIYEQLMNGEIELADDFENTITVGDKKKRISWKSTFLRDKEGKITGLLSSGLEVTKERELQEALERERNKYRTLFENSLAGVYLGTLEGEILECNTALAKMFGYDDAEQMKKVNVDSLYFDPKKREENIAKILEEKSLFSHEFKLKKRDGTPLWILGNISLIENKYLLGALLDITERKKIEIELAESEKELRELNESKDRFFNIIAHDIRSPFTALLGYTQLLLDEYETSSKEEIGTYVEALSRTANNIFKFIEELLEWSRAQSGRIVLEPTTLSLRNEVENIVYLNKDVAAQKNVSIENNVPEDILVVSDENVLTTTLRNLISNAIKFTNEEGQIIITANNKHGKIVVSVKDTGVGISRENLNSLFKVGSHFSTPGTRKETGSGLGLLLVKELLERQGGKIWVESEAGKGSTFYFTLPLADEEETK